MHAAASTDSVMVCRHLIEAGAAIDCRDYEEKTPLHIASQFGKAQIARLLLDQIDPTDETAKRMRFVSICEWSPPRDSERDYFRGSSSMPGT